MPSERKLAEFRRLAGDGGLVSHTMFSIAGGQTAVAPLLEAGVTGVVCASDTLALDAIRGARKQGRRVPGQLSVVGFDDSVYMPMMDPPLTTVRQPIAAIGVAAVHSLVAQIERRPVPLDEELFEPELIVRSSTAAAPQGVAI